MFQAKKSKVEKPDKTVYCPMSRKPIRVKDLVDVQWTVARDPDDKRSLIARLILFYLIYVKLIKS